MRLADPVEQKLPLIQAPCLIVRGDRDTLAPQRWVEEMGCLIPDSRVAVIAGGTHAANFSAPDQLAQLVREFVGQ